MSVKDRFFEIGQVIAVVIFLYVAVSAIVYQFRHPDMTQTRVILNIKDVLLWR